VTASEPQRTIVAASAIPQPVTGEFASVSSPPSMLGKVFLDRYRVIGHLGDGGMGSVYLVEHTTILKKLAIKVLSPALAVRADFTDRFLREARAASAINHPNVVEITDFGATDTGEPFFVMEYLQGEDLSQTIINEGPIPWSRARPIILQICSALQAAHEQGIVHRDMKPGNCLRIKHGNNADYVKVLDFGIAKVTSSEVENKALTQTGTVIGTPEYMSPEQGWGHPVDHRSDIYAVGVILYELLSGRVPFAGETMMEILNRHIYEVPDISHPNISAEVGAIVLKAMQKDRTLRFQSMSEMIEAIERVGTGAPVVKVVDEEIKAPWGVHTARYSTAVTHLTHRPDEGAITAMTPALPTSPPRSKALWAVLLAVGAIGAVVIGLALAGPDAPTPTGEPTPSVIAGAPTTETPAPLPTPPPVIIEPAAQRVRLNIMTPGVDAQILDANDERIYGMSSAAEGVEVKRSSEPLRLVLRAAGYEDLEISVVPDEDKRYEKSLVKSKSQKSRPSKGPRPGDEKPPAAEPVSQPNLGEIKDPFAGK
jgi:tRNA A-37 threonylcarbamoyl transferase component Bud32